MRDFLSAIFGTVEPWLVRAHSDTDTKMGSWREGRGLPLSDADDAFYCVAELKPGATSRSLGNAERVRVLVFDDIGVKIDKTMMEMVCLPPSFVVETSPGSEQWGYIIDGGMTVAEYDALREAMEGHWIWGKSDGADAVHVFRLPFGTNTKPKHNGAKPKLLVSGGPIYTPKALEALTGGAPVKAPAAAGAQGSSASMIFDIEALRELLALVPNPAGDTRGYWISVGHYVMGAFGSGGYEPFEEWSARHASHNQAKCWRFWDTIKPSNVMSRGGKLRELAENADAEGFGAWKRKWEPAATVFNDEAPPPDQTAVTMFTVNDFRSVVGEVDFIHVGKGNFWKPISVDAKVAPVVVGVKEDGTPITVKATTWLRKHGYVTELSWLPGLERIVKDRSIGVMGLEVRPMHSVFNLYQAPVVVGVETIWAEPWCDLVRRLWPDEAGEIFDWFAHRVQRPGEKCNHALVLGGAQGIGKDTVLEAVRRAVGVGNCNEIMPSDLKGNFNDHVKSVLLVINELRDDDAVTQYVLYEKSKTLIAAPPYTLSINSKYIKKYVVPNVVGVVMTTNHKETGLYLPADDRRHLVCWSDVDAGAEGDGEFARIWAWLNGGGFDHVAAWLRARDLSGFDCKAPPRKTRAFHEIVGAAFNPGEKALQDKIEKMGKAKVMRIKDLKVGAGEAFDEEGNVLDNFLNEPKYRKVVAEALGRFGYRKIMNPAREDGRWKIGGALDYVYGRKDVPIDELKSLAGKLGALDEERGGKA